MPEHRTLELPTDCPRPTEGTPGTARADARHGEWEAVQVTLRRDGAHRQQTPLIRLLTARLRWLRERSAARLAARRCPGDTA